MYSNLLRFFQIVQILEQRFFGRDLIDVNVSIGGGGSKTLKEYELVFDNGERPYIPIFTKNTYKRELGDVLIRMALQNQQIKPTF